MYHVDKFMQELKAANPAEAEFHQAVEEVVHSVLPIINERPDFEEARILERLTEPDRIISFRVEWEDDDGRVQVNKGFRVQFSQVLGPYKGGLRFHPNVTQGGLKFLGFEQTFKNSLTGLPLGGGKGGSDFNPKGKSDGEIRRFCKSFMTALFKYLGPDMDVPAGDIGVGGRELGYLYGQYKRLTAQHSGVLTGKGISWGGSLIRPEATGFGSLYFADELFKEAGSGLEGKTISLSGFGNVAWGAAVKAAELGAKVVTISGPDGYIYDPDGISSEDKLNYMLELRYSNNDVVEPYAKEFGVEFFPENAHGRYQYKSPSPAPFRMN
jgi:glutamate dehydrogenase (NADP+)